MRTDPQVVYMRMMERYKDETPEKVYEQKRDQDNADRDHIHKVLKQRDIEKRRKENIAKALASPNRGKTKLFRVFSSDKEGGAVAEMQKELSEQSTNKK